MIIITLLIKLNFYNWNFHLWPSFSYPDDIQTFCHREVFQMFEENSLVLPLIISWVCPFPILTSSSFLKYSTHNMMPRTFNIITLHSSTSSSSYLTLANVDFVYVLTWNLMQPPHGLWSEGGDHGLCKILSPINSLTDLPHFLVHITFSRFKDIYLLYLNCS